MSTYILALKINLENKVERAAIQGAKSKTAVIYILDSVWKTSVYEEKYIFLESTNYRTL